VIMVTTYELNEIVMCKSRPDDKFGYPAKIQAVAKDDKGRNRYEIHYKGWNIRYDIWVESEEVDNMLFKHTPEIEAEHKKLLDESKGKTAKKKAVETPVSATLAKKRKTDREGSADSSQGSGIRTMPAKDDLINIAIPDKLRALMVDDSDLINRQSKLAKLPAQYTVDMIIKAYAQSLAGNLNISDVSGNDETLVEYGKGGGKQKDVVLNKHDMVQSSLGVLDYFNILLGSQLLYSKERAQFKACCQNPPAGAPGDKVNKQVTPELEDLKIIPSSIYGISHLVRLFVRIGPLIGQGAYGDKSLQIILKHMHDLLVFLSKNAATYHNINRDYEVAAKPNETTIDN
ncbi:hypothetical protein PENTCL1PPCAC_10962, partial [Pristionchus entomophagus]